MSLVYLLPLSTRLKAGNADLSLSSRPLPNCGHFLGQRLATMVIALMLYLVKQVRKRRSTGLSTTMLTSRCLMCQQVCLSALIYA